MTGRVQVWVGGTVAAVAVVGLAVHLMLVGLDAADKWASVLGLFVALAGLGVAMAGLRQNRQEGGSQSVENSTLGGAATQVARTGGNVRINHHAPASLPATGPPTGAVPPVGMPPVPDGGQSVRNSQTSGPVDQVQSTDGNVEIEGP
ncbi:hypothetical protein AS594_36295 [Streptomyces agglomeratus]|uniref:Uncharacterized protein n=1 Tax=Streptomyces agglomeratus TaxID=285458 RepID=A0A1E5PHR5_9ACTN|nr:hypothetical protein AS594_36295 [Streptomyces agglomeratus]